MLTRTGKDTIGGKWCLKKRRRKVNVKLSEAQRMITKLRKERRIYRKKERKGEIEAKEKACQLSSKIEQVEREENDSKVAVISENMRGSALSKRKNFFSYINYMKDVETMEASLTDQEGKSILEDKRIEKELTQFYKEVYDAATFDNATKVQNEEDMPKIDDIEKENLVHSLTMDEMLMVIKETKAGNKSAGLSNIPPEFIKWASYEMKEYIFDWICQMWREEVTPVESGKSTITMLHKKGDKSKIKNYIERYQWDVMYAKFFSKLLKNE